MNIKQIILDFLAKVGKIDDKVKEKLKDVDISEAHTNVSIFFKEKRFNIYSTIKGDWLEDELEGPFMNATSTHTSYNISCNPTGKCSNCGTRLPKISRRHYCWNCGKEIK